MNEVVVVLAVIVVIALVITRQLKGEALRAKRVLILPAVLIVLGVAGLNGATGFKPVDGVLMAASGIAAAAVGLGMGVTMQLENRNGGLWGRLPRRGLWLWAALIASRLVVAVVAVVIGAKVATSGDSILLTLGINRLVQAAVIAARALSAGVPFTPESNGKTYMTGIFGQAAMPQDRDDGQRQRSIRTQTPAQAQAWTQATDARSVLPNTHLSDIARLLNDRFGQAR